MARTGIFVIAATTSVSDHLSPAQLIFHNLTARHHLEQLPAWTLDHRLFRETPAAGDPPADGAAAACLQFLHLSHQPGGETFAAVTRPATDGADAQAAPAYGPATLLCMPTAEAGEDLAALMAARFGPLWTRRQSLHVAGGQAFRGRGFTVRVGEAREARPGQGGAAQLRSTVAEICVTDPGAGEDRVREIWAGLEVAGAREFVAVPGLDQGHDGVRQWLEALRPKVA